MSYLWPRIIVSRVALTLGSIRCLEEGMATRSSILDWRIPWTEEPDRLYDGASYLDSVSELSGWC